MARKIVLSIIAVCLVASIGRAQESGKPKKLSEITIGDAASIPGPSLQRLTLTGETGDVSSKLFGPTPSNVVYRKLYFAETCLERHGECLRFQNTRSALTFAANSFLYPFRAYQDRCHQYSKSWHLPRVTGCGIGP